MPLFSPASFIKPLVESLVGPIFDAINKAGDRKVTREVLAAEIEKALIAGQAQIAAEQSRIIVAEAQGEGWLQRNARPLVMLVSFFSCWAVIFPYGFMVHYGLLPQIRFGEVGLQYFFNLTMICVGGYIGGKTLEKLANR